MFAHIDLPEYAGRALMAAYYWFCNRQIFIANPGLE